jgi:predicted phage terminase large subunit-like protein
VSLFGSGVAAIPDAPPDFLTWLRMHAPAGWSYGSRHLVRIAEECDGLTNGLWDRLITQMPPRHAKSETSTIKHTVYELERDPTKRILIVTHTQELANRFGRRIRQMARRHVQLSPESSAMSEFETMQGGIVMLRGIGSPPTGTGFDIIKIDDPIKTRKQAESALFRARLWDAYQDDILSRLEPGGYLQVTNTRWHHDDLVGRILASADAPNWRNLRLPALAEKEDPLGRAPGEALWPERYPLSMLERIRDGQDRDGELNDRYSWESLYQQNPTPKKGAFFDVSQILIVDAVPAGLPRFRAWDIANSTSGDWTVGFLAAGPDRDGLWYLVGRVKGRWESAERNRVIRQTAEVMDGYSVPIEVPHDPGAGGKEAAAHLVKLLAGYKVDAYRVTSNKTASADGLAAQVNAGNVRMLRGPWNGETLEEMRTFPAGRHVDEVDAMPRAFNRLALRATSGTAVVGRAIERPDLR